MRCWILSGRTPGRPTRSWRRKPPGWPGGIAAALAAGNSVILKPAPDTVLVAHELCRCFWRAGVSRRTLLMVTCTDELAGARLVSHPQVDAVILTGGTDTALHLPRGKPDMNLLAETGGKNATTLSAREAEPRINAS